MDAEETETTDMTTPVEPHDDADTGKKDETDSAVREEGEKEEVDADQNAEAVKDDPVEKKDEQEKESDAPKEATKEQNSDDAAAAADDASGAPSSPNTSSATDPPEKNTAERKETAPAPTSVKTPPPESSPASPTGRVRALSSKLWTETGALATESTAETATPKPSTKRVIDIPTPTPIPSTSINDNGAISDNPQSLIELKIALANAKSKIDEQHLVMLRISEERYRITHQLTTLHEDYEKLEVEHAEWQKMYADLEIRAKQGDAHSQKLESENEGLQTQVEILKATLQESENQYEQQRTNNALLETKVATLESQFQSLLEKNQSVTMEKATLQSELDEAQTSLKKSARENKIVRDKRMKLEYKVDQLEHTNVELKKSMKDLAAQHEEEKKIQNTPPTGHKQKSKRAFLFARALGSSRHGMGEKVGKGSKHGDSKHGDSGNNPPPISTETKTDNRSSWHGFGHKQRKSDSKHGLGGKKDSKHGFLKSPRGHKKSKEEMEQLVKSRTAVSTSVLPAPPLSRHDKQKKKYASSPIAGAGDSSDFAVSDSQRSSTLQPDNSEHSSQDPQSPPLQHQNRGINEPKLPPSSALSSKKKKKSVKRLSKAVMGQHVYSSAANKALSGTPPPSEGDQMSEVSKSSRKEGHVTNNNSIDDQRQNSKTGDDDDDEDVVDKDVDTSMLVCRTFDDDKDLLANLGVDGADGAGES